MTPQLKDYIDWAAQNGYQFRLTVSSSAKIASTVNSVPNIQIVPVVLP